MLSILSIENLSYQEYNRKTNMCSNFRQIGGEAMAGNDIERKEDWKAELIEEIKGLSDEEAALIWDLLKTLQNE